MTRRSRTNQSVERRLDALETNADDTERFEITITDRVVATDWDPPADADTGDVFQRTRVWRDEHGDWHSERTSRPGDGGDS